jgi:VWFA-related protein
MNLRLRTIACFVEIWRADRKLGTHELEGYGLRRSALRVASGVGLLVLAASLVGQALLAQQAPVPSQPVEQTGGGFTLRVKSQIVVLDVVVTDRKGVNVRHLKPEDFLVLEDKVPQTIKSFEEVGPVPPAAFVPVDSTAELDRLEPNAPVNIIVIDELTTQFQDLAFARYSLQKYLKTQGEQLDQPTMLISANFTNVAVLHDYTTSRKEILDAIEHHLASINTVTRTQDSSWQSEQVNGAFASLMSVAEATAGHPGHKNLIWVGRGFPPIDPLKLMPADRETLDKGIASCTNLLRDARVTLYAIDPAGLSAEQPAQDEDGFEIDPFGGQFDFDTMVTATGGRALYGRNDVDAMIGQSVRDGETFYTVSYAPKIATDDTKPFRNIRIVMKDPNLSANTREGYYEHGDAVAPVREADGKYSNRLLFDINAASSSLLVYDGIPLTVARDVAKPDTFVLHLQTAGLQTRDAAPGKPNAELTVVLESFDRKGKLLDRIAHLVSLHVGRAGGGVDVPQTIATQAPAARVRVVVRDNNSGKIGAENVYLVDPKTIDDPALDYRVKHK